MPQTPPPGEQPRAKQPRLRPGLCVLQGRAAADGRLASGPWPRRSRPCLRAGERPCASYVQSCSACTGAPGWLLCDVASPGFHDLPAGGGQVGALVGAFLGFSPDIPASGLLRPGRRSPAVCDSMIEGHNGARRAHQDEPGACGAAVHRRARRARRGPPGYKSRCRRGALLGAGVGRRGPAWGSDGSARTIRGRRTPGI